MAMNAEQWALVLAPGTTPASEEAMDHFTATLNEHYESAITQVLSEWPVLVSEPDYHPEFLSMPEKPEAASWSSSTGMTHAGRGETDEFGDCIPF